MHSLHPNKPSSVCPSYQPLSCCICAGNSLTSKVLRSAVVQWLVQIMLVVQTKKLYDAQEGRAAAAAPRTSRSGRPIEGPGSSQPVQVRASCIAAWRHGK